MFDLPQVSGKHRCLSELRTMEIVTVLPPLVKGNIGTPDEGERIVVDLPVKRRKSLVDLGWR